MTPSRSTILLLVPALMILAACGPATTAPSPAPAGTRDGTSRVPAVDEPMEQSDDGGGVTVKATWVGSAAGIAFEVALDTHSVDLEGLDLRDATLQNDNGDRIADPVWDADTGGHHRSGRLTFQGDPGTFLAATAWIELSVPGVAGVPFRTLRWTVDG